MEQDINYDDFEVTELDGGWAVKKNNGHSMGIMCSEEFKWSYPYEKDSEFDPSRYPDEERRKSAQQDHETDKQFKAAIRQYIKDRYSPDIDHQWEIQKARFFGYNETTLALIKGPDEQHYIVRSACYPYGKAQRDSTITRIDPKKCGSKPHWNDLLDEIAGDDNDLERMAAELKALPFIPCTTDDPFEEFEEVAEIERFMSRIDLAEKYEVTQETKTQRSNDNRANSLDGIENALLELDALFNAMSAGKELPELKEHKTPSATQSIYDAFMRTDLQRNQWYFDENAVYETRNGEQLPLLPIGKTHLSLDEVKETIETICRDFGIACPNHTSITPFNWMQRAQGSYEPETTNMRLMQAEYGQGVPYSLLLHEMAHHINNTFVHNGEPESAGHGYRFKKIHMHLMHHYAGVETEALINHFGHIYSGSWNGETPLKLREQDIIGRDFTETRTWDVLPAEVEEQDNHEGSPMHYGHSPKHIGC